MPAFPALTGASATRVGRARRMATVGEAHTIGASVVHKPAPIETVTARLVNPLWARACLLALIAFVLIRASSWTLQQPYPTGWDDALYRNQLLQDVQAYQAA